MPTNKILSLFLVLLFTLVMGVNFAAAVPASVKAKSEYLLADKQFNNGNFTGAIEHAKKSLAILGKTNSRIQYLLTKAYVATKQPDLALAAIEKFFAITPESMSRSDQYNEMVEQYSMIEESVRKLREVEEQERVAQGIAQDIQYCGAVCWAETIPLYRQKEKVCFVEAEKKKQSMNKSAGGWAREESDVLIAETSNDGPTVNDLAKPCTEKAWNTLKPLYKSCASHCQDQKFRQKKLQKGESTHRIPLILGESKVLGYNFSYTALTDEILHVVSPSPAQIAGFAEGDFIVAVDGKPIKKEEYINNVRDKIISGEIESAVLDVRRNGQKMEYLLKK